MPSSNKTSHLSLNWWLGSDKPKKDDFNDDNQLVDAAFGRLAGRLDQLEQAGDHSEVAANLQAHVADTGLHMGAEDRGSLGQIAGLLAHAANGGIHVTPEEKAAWSAAGGGAAAPVIGAYVGDEWPDQAVSLGFSPQYGFLFAVNKGAYESDWIGQESLVYSGFFSNRGSSQYIEVTAGGLKVYSTPRPLNGCSFRYNDQGVTYVYVAWK